VFSLDVLERKNMEAFLMAFDSDLAPIVGQQITLTDQSSAQVDNRVDLLIARSATPFTVPLQGEATECDLVVSGVVNGEARRWLRQPDGTFISDADPDMPILETDLRAEAEVPGQPLTFTCAPPGSGPRMAGLTGAGGGGGQGGAGGTTGSGGSAGEPGSGGFAGDPGQGGQGGQQPPAAGDGNGCNCRVTESRSELPMTLLLAAFCLAAVRRMSRRTGD
jgi:MYXO-CTERM domain-containing protein